MRTLVIALFSATTLVFWTFAGFYFAVAYPVSPIGAIKATFFVPNFRSDHAWKKYKLALEYVQVKETISYVKDGGNPEKANEKGCTYLCLAAQFNRINIVKFLLHKKVNINSRDKKKKTPLMYASEMGHNEVVRVLIRGGADVNAKTPSGWTALEYAKFYGHYKLQSYLLNVGAKDYIRKTASNKE